MRPLQGDIEALPGIRERISKLPAPEQILKLKDKELQQLRGIVDRINYDLDRADFQRSPGKAASFTNRTHLPPRRQPLQATNWYQRAILTSQVPPEYRWEPLDIKDPAKKNQRWLPCGLCGGAGEIKEYEDTWTCPECDGRGGSWIPK